jgi:hypothetical protein
MKPGEKLPGFFLDKFSPIYYLFLMKTNDIQESDLLPFENFILNTKDVKKWIEDKNRYYILMTGKKRPKSSMDSLLLETQKKMPRRKVTSKTQAKIKKIKPHHFSADIII